MDYMENNTIPYHIQYLVGEVFEGANRNRLFRRVSASSVVLRQIRHHDLPHGCNTRHPAVYEGKTENDPLSI